MPFPEARSAQHTTHQGGKGEKKQKKTRKRRLAADHLFPVLHNLYFPQGIIVPRRADEDGPPVLLSCSDVSYHVIVHSWISILLSTTTTSEFTGLEFQVWMMSKVWRASQTSNKKKVRAWRHNTSIPNATHTERNYATLG